MTELTALDYINVGKAGTFADSGDVATSAKQVDEIFDYLNQRDIETLLIYFHGGLVSEKNGLGAAAVMQNHFSNADKKRHVVSFVWETGPKEVIIQNIGSIIKGAESSFYQEALNFVIKIVARRLGLADGKGAMGTYLSDATIKEEKRTTSPFEELDKLHGAKGGVSELKIEKTDEIEYLNDLQDEAEGLIGGEASDEFKNTTTLNNPELTDDLKPETDGKPRGGWLTIAKIVAEIAFKVLKRYINKTHHDFYPTVMEETFRKLYAASIGEWGWSQIKKKADTMFADNTGLEGIDLHAGSCFLNSLQKHYLSRIENNKKFSIQLIGHSAGSIVICYLLKSVMRDYKKLKFETVFFLAPACRVDLFLDNFIVAREKGFFKNFKMFTMKTENEKKDHCIRYVYTHSLLYMVSGLFEIDADNNSEIDAKILGLHEQFSAEGRYQEFEELKKVKTFLSGYKFVLSDDIINEDISLHSEALQHGDFDNDEPTLFSILKSL